MRFANANKDKTLLEITSGDDSMSGTETLLPYLKEKKGEEEQPTIIVDSREASTAAKIVKALCERGARVQTQILEKGDYILSDQCAVERKTVHFRTVVQAEGSLP